MIAKRYKFRVIVRLTLLSSLALTTTGCSLSGNRGSGLGFPLSGPWSRSNAEATPESQPMARIANAKQPTNGFSHSDLNSGHGSFDVAATKSSGPISLVSFDDLSIEHIQRIDQGDSSARYQLSDLENLAIQNSPTLRQLELSASKAAAFRTQVGLRPNASFGYSGQQLDDVKTDQHILFLERDLITGQKLQLNERVLNANVRGQLREADAQRNRILADVRTAHARLLGEKTKSRTLLDFTEAAQKAVELTELRRDAKEGSQIDVLQARTQLNQVRMQQEQAAARANAIAQELAALSGIDFLTPGDIAGDLTVELQEIDWHVLLADLRETNPEYQVANANLERALANWRRQNAQTTPNISVQIGAGVDRATDHGMINTQVSAPLMINNRNQGNISAAHADYCMAQLELQRIDRALRVRVSQLSGEFDAAKAVLHRYRGQLLPDIQQTLDLANQAFVAGETDFLEVLIIRRTYFELRLQAIDAERDLILAEANLENFGLTGALEPINDNSGDSSLRDLSFGQQ